MAKQITITCNNCGWEKGHNDSSTGDAWLTLSNPDLPSGNRDKVCLDEEHHFCGFVCLAKWSARAAAQAPILKDAADGLRPRGTFVNEELGLIYP